MHRYRLALALLLVAALAGGALAHPPQARAAQACFAETGFCVEGRFLGYWQANGGLALNGYPLTEERRELLEDGKTYTVQYFERVRLEYHPENPPPYDVLLGQFGRRIQRGVMAAESPQDGARYFPETGHNLGGTFRDYWEANGGLARFGLPLSEEYSVILEDRGQYFVQYFERARFEHHPENAAPNDILLGQFGRRILAENALLEGDFGALYLTNARVRDRLGPPRGRTEAVPGATQAFERGRMLYFGGAFLDHQFGNYEGERRIYVLCGSEESGRVTQDSLRGRFYYADTWAEGQEPGGGPTPMAGLYYPQRGFGKVWREQPGVRECVGYARTPDERATTLTVQSFANGLLVASTADAGQYIYALYFVPLNLVSYVGSYDRWVIAPRTP